MGGLSKLMLKYNKAAGEFSGTGATLAEEVFSSIRNTTSLENQERLAQKYDKYLIQAEIWGRKAKAVTGLMLGSMILIMFSNYALSFWQGSRYLVSGDMNIGQIITVLFSVMMGSVMLGQVAPHFQSFAVAIATAGPIFSVIDRPLPDESKKGLIPTYIRGEVELRAIRHIYPSRPEVVVLKGMDLVIPAGKVTALVGPSGSGKSTIVGLLERFYTPVGGELLLDGANIQGLDLKWLRQQMALVSQEPVLFGVSVFENIAHGLIGSDYEKIGEEKKMEMVIGAAKMANAHDFISNLPGGYSMNVGERGFLL
jgi:ATP-binding cassette subfamily B (MDR/TAP) protein 1